jgi:hypothetical protein
LAAPTLVRLRPKLIFPAISSLDFISRTDPDYDARLPLILRQPRQS